MRIVAAATIVALSFPAISQQPDVWVVGIGVENCSAWAFDPRRRAEGQAWILGYWSGLNMANGSMVGFSTDGIEMIERVKDECRANPALRLSDAVAKVRADLREDGR